VLSEVRGYLRLPRVSSVEGALISSSVGTDKIVVRDPH